jgi:hypothetical protein
LAFNVGYQKMILKIKEQGTHRTAGIQHNINASKKNCYNRIPFPILKQLPTNTKINQFDVINTNIIINGNG